MKPTIRKKKYTTKREKEVPSVTVVIGKSDSPLYQWAFNLGKQYENPTQGRLFE